MTPSNDDSASWPSSRSRQFECSFIETSPLCESSRLPGNHHSLQIRLRKLFIMPHHPSEEETESNVFDKVAKGNPESNASDHPMHKEGEEPVKASAADHQSKGPAIPDSKPTPSPTGSEL
jgi:hypothetical protein